MEWVITCIALLIAAGCAIYAKGVSDGNQRPLHITQTNTVSQHNTNSGGSGSSAKTAASALVPVVGLVAIGVIAYSAITAGTQQTAQVSAVSQTALTTQAQIVQAYPQPQQPVIVHDAAPAQSVTVGDILSAIVVIEGGIGAAFVVRELRRGKRQRPVRRATQQGLTHPAFSQPKSEIKK